MTAPPSADVRPETSAAGVRPDTLTLVSDVNARFRVGDESALKELYDEHGSLIYSICRRTVGENRAADVTQEVFISAWKSRDRFDPARGSMAGWLTGIAKFRCIDALRKDGRRPSVVGINDDISVDVEANDTIETAGRIIDRMLLAEALTQLSDRARTAVELSFLEDLSHGEVAERTGVPLGTVKSDIRRGLAHLRRHLEASHV